MGNLTSMFSVEKVCRERNVDFNVTDCIPKFRYDAATNMTSVLSLGNVPRGQLEVEPDVAGIGYKSNILIRVIVRTAPARPESRRVSHEPGSYRAGARRLFAHFGSNSTLNAGNDASPLEDFRPQAPGTGREGIFTTNQETTGYQEQPWPTQPKVPTVHTENITPVNQAAWPGYLPVENPSHNERPSSPSIDITVDKPPSSSPERPPFNEQLYDVLQAALLAITDSQILLSIAFSASYYYNGKCQMTLYHFRLAINIVEIACANAFLSLLLVRDYWKAPLSALIRLVALTVSFILLYSLMQTQNEVGFSAEYMPPMERKDSLVLLRATCFLFKDFAGTVFASSNSANATFASIPGLPLTPAQYAVVGGLDTDTHGHHEWRIVVALGVNLGLTVVYGIFRWLRPMTPDGIARTLFFGYSAATWLFVLAVLVLNSTRVFGLRDWVAKSGWFGDDNENYVGLGQWAALLAMGSIVLQGGDQWRPMG